jgi:hypothetical protein
VTEDEGKSSLFIGLFLFGDPNVIMVDDFGTSSDSKIRSYSGEFVEGNAGFWESFEFSLIFLFGE